MPRSIKLAADLNAGELKARYRRASEPVERSHLRVIWLLARNRSQATVATLTGYSTRQIRAITKRYNEGGPEALGDQRRRNVGSKPLLDAVGQAELVLALAQPPSDGGLWTGRKVATWIACKTGEAVSAKRGWAYLARIRSAREHRRTPVSGPTRPGHGPIEEMQGANPVELKDSGTFSGLGRAQGVKNLSG